MSTLTTKELLIQNTDILKQLKYCKPSVRSYIINRADSNLIECFSRIILNIVEKKYLYQQNNLKN